MKPQKKQRLFELSTATQSRLLHLIADKSAQVSKIVFIDPSRVYFNALIIKDKFDEPLETQWVTNNTAEYIEDELKTLRDTLIIIGDYRHIMYESHIEHNQKLSRAIYNTRTHLKQNNNILITIP